jgi:ubiquinone/menaquinone biosynthesis C-methylase UbiE
VNGAEQRDPFDRHPTRRYSWAWSRLPRAGGRHLDLGCGPGVFLVGISEKPSGACIGGDPHGGYLATLRATDPELPLVQVDPRGPLPFPDHAFESVSLLDVLEHTASEQDVLGEVRRVLEPGGVLLVTVPARHVFSVLDPDNAKFRMPKIHRIVYTARFGAATYTERFEDLSNGMRGDMHVDRHDHTNYDPAAFVRIIEDCGFEPQERSGANLFWRLMHGPYLLAPPRVRPLLDPLLRWDGRTFARANLFVAARRTP